MPRLPSDDEEALGSLRVSIQEYHDDDGGDDDDDAAAAADPDGVLPDVQGRVGGGPRHPVDFAHSEEAYNRRPIWLAEADKDYRWRWVPLVLRRAGRATVDWLNGPVPPDPLILNPLFPHVQEAPVKVLNWLAPKRRYKVALLVTVYAAWLVSWSTVLHHSVSSGQIPGYGKPTPIGCTASFWSANNKCGLNGSNCRPFSSSIFAFRCPAFCSSNLRIDDYTVGNQTIAYSSLVIGGPRPDGPEEDATYRADSWICQAATHAGVISDNGGCGVVELTGAANYYYGSKRHGYTSIEFPSTFPKSYRFIRDIPGLEKSCHRDLRWPLLAITAVTVVTISVFTTDPAVFFFTTFFLLMLQIGIVSDPPELTQIREMFSTSASRLLPATFIAYVMYHYCAKPLLEPLQSPPVYQLSKTVLYLLPAFIGALNNYTFAMWIPIQRLTPHDIKSQPGARIALGVMITIIVSIVLSQAWWIRQGGRFFHYLKIYLCLCGGVIILLALPGFRLRIHHYILALLLMPGTSFPTRPSIIYQGLLLGLFINGVARWGFASIIETPSMLGELPREGHSAWWGATTPNITDASVTISLPDAPAIQPSGFAGQLSALLDPRDYRGNGNISINLWDHKRMDELGVDGVSVLVNDVERFRGYRDEDPFGRFVWHRRGSRGLDEVPRDLTIDASRADHDAVDLRQRKAVARAKAIQAEEYGNGDDEMVALSETQDAPEDLFFRFAFLRGSAAGLYGGVGVWNADGSWVSPPPPK
ncbi:hypothetical protein KEM52_006103 [Ascosphaera acerosa]|nr:hypothetical protein KEM52_006103 [Ascosphaera acerosa]